MTVSHYSATKSCDAIKATVVVWQFFPPAFRFRYWRKYPGIYMTSWRRVADIRVCRRL